MASRDGMSDDTRAIALLCGHFSARRGDWKPLSPTEYHGLTTGIGARGPGTLLGEGADGLTAICGNDGVSGDRLAALLSRDRELETALTRWRRAGIWIMGEGDADYPSRLRHRLGSGGFPLLFGAGPSGSLDRGGVCIVGSRDGPESGLAFARSLGARCAREGMTVISSDMRGVDREAISAALGQGGRVISVLSDSLEKAAAARRNREALEDGSITLLTPFSPDTRFSVSNAMRANKYQYALSDVAVVVETRRRGGVWSGADENRNEGWVPAFVRSGEGMSPGNTALAHLGLAPITQEQVEGCARLEDLFLRRDARTGEETPVRRRLPDLYDGFLRGLAVLAADGPLSEARVMELFAIERSQARRWLARAVAEGRVERLESPVRFRVAADAGASGDPPR